MRNRTPPDRVALAVIMRGIEAPCQVSRVSDVLAWVLPLFGDTPGTGRLDIRCACRTLPAEIERAAVDLRAGRSFVRRLMPGRRGRQVRLDLSTTYGRETFCLLAPWSEGAAVLVARRHVLAVAGGSRSFWVELPRDKGADLAEWFRRRGLGKVVDMDEWAKASAPPSKRRR